jgi:hypothetical protein
VLIDKTGAGIGWLNAIPGAFVFCEADPDSNVHGAQLTFLHVRKNTGNGERTRPRVPPAAPRSRKMRANAR